MRCLPENKAALQCIFAATVNLDYHGLRERNDHNESFTGVRLCREKKQLTRYLGGKFFRRLVPVW